MPEKKIPLWLVVLPENALCIAWLLLAFTLFESTGIMVDWDLSDCCKREEITFLCLYGGYALFTLFFEKTALLKPMRLLGTVSLVLEFVFAVISGKVDTSSLVLMVFSAVCSSFMKWATHPPAG